MTNYPLIYNKLVRDKIPEKILNSGLKASTKILDPAEFDHFLRLKLLEESYELFHAESQDQIINEIADLLELIDSILQLHGIDMDKVFSKKENKHEINGGFQNRIFLHATANEKLVAKMGDWDERLPQLLTFNSQIALVDIIKRELIDSEALHIASAFYSRGMLNLLLDPFRAFTERGGRLRFLTSVMQNFNNPNDFLHLQSLIPDLEIRIFHPLKPNGEADFNQTPPNFHLKSFLFQKATGNHSIIVGSSNLTGSGLAGNHEWNYFSNNEINLKFSNNQSSFEHALREFESYWYKSSVPIDDSFMSVYLPRWEMANAKKIFNTLEIEQLSKSIVEPRPAQEDALQSLSNLRTNGIEKAAVIAATGLGKTYLAAFDFKQSEFRNVLFVAHRENILIKAQETFHRVLEDPSFGEILSGNSKPSITNGLSLFAMVQTLSQPANLAEFDAEAFDYIVIDEFHHAEAASYQRVLDKFRPKFLLGLTATPERMDGRDVLRICDFNVAYEARLFDAIENGWLIPFQYFAIYDPTDYSELRWTSRGYIETELDEVLMHDTRAELIFNNLRKFLPAIGKIKALAFCSSRNHAEYMNKKFNEIGKPYKIESVCLLGTNSIEEREHAIKRLQDEKDNLQIICSVDIFGEGIDIPAISHVLFLRPTQSFTVFLQQMGRGLRSMPGKDFLVLLDFVGNFRQSYVARLVMQGYSGLEDYRQANRAKQPEKQLPLACYVSVDQEVTRIWNSEIKRALAPVNRFEALKDLYWEIRNSLEKSPSLMDFFVNPTAHDPYVFLKEKKFGGNWLRVKATVNDLADYEATLLDTPAEHLLQHIETEMSPAKSYKMVVLRSLIELGGTEWEVEDIARLFHNYYLKNQDRMADWDELNRYENPNEFPINKTVSHLTRMPLEKLANTGKEFFYLDKQKNIFKIKEIYQKYWLDKEFKTLAADRVEFGLARYFYQKDKKAVVPQNLKGFVTEVPYAVKSDSGYTALISKVIAENPSKSEWSYDFHNRGYSADMDIEIHNEKYFIAWTHNKYEDITRFPARIKAAATALYKEGFRGAFQVVSEGNLLKIIRK